MVPKGHGPELPISKTMAGVDMRLAAGGIREMHWHTAAEWAIISTAAQELPPLMLRAAALTPDTHEGDLWYFPTGIPHSIQGLAPDGAEFLLVFDDGSFSEYINCVASDLMAHTPKEVLSKNYGIPEPSLATLRNKELFIFQGPVPPPLAETQK